MARRSAGRPAFRDILLLALLRRLALEPSRRQALQASENLT